MYRHKIEIQYDNGEIDKISFKSTYRHIELYKKIKQTPVIFEGMIVGYESTVKYKTRHGKEQHCFLSDNRINKAKLIETI